LGSKAKDEEEGKLTFKCARMKYRGWDRGERKIKQEKSEGELKPPIIYD
jgi:hypothetical protein